MNVNRLHDCTGYSYTIEWIAKGGQKTPISITNSGSVSPSGTTVAASIVQSGGVLFKPLTGDMTRLYQTIPQVKMKRQYIQIIYNTDIFFSFIARSKSLLVVIHLNV